jgi:hypothetical protein
VPAKFHDTGLRLWAKRALGVLAIAGFLILAGFLGAAFVPRWWAHAIGDQVNGGIATGIIVGLFYGFFFTGLPLLVLWRTFKKRRPWKVWAFGLLLAIALALPNLFTLGIVLGTGNASHAGERTLDVEAPGFRGGALAGAIVATLTVALFEYIVISGRMHRRKFHRLEQELKDREREDKERAAAEKAEAKAAAEAAKATPEPPAVPPTAEPPIEPGPPPA